MLSGRAPFHARSRDDSAAAVMARIKGGEFSFSADAWAHVSAPAKRVTRGLLTVDPKQRLTIEVLRTNEWLQGTGPFPATPLMTPDVLGATAVRAVELGVAQTFNAFHRAHREGFRLQEVSNAKLAQRRRMKKSSTDARSSSTSSTFSTSSSSGEILFCTLSRKKCFVGIFLHCCIPGTNWVFISGYFYFKVKKMV